MSTRHELIEMPVTNYPSSSWARTVGWVCSCGKRGEISDGRMGATFKRARSAHRRHVAAAIK